MIPASLPLGNGMIILLLALVWWPGSAFAQGNDGMLLTTITNPTPVAFRLELLSFFRRQRRLSCRILPFVLLPSVGGEGQGFGGKGAGGGEPAPVFVPQGVKAGRGLVSIVGTCLPIRRSTTRGQPRRRSSNCHWANPRSAPFFIIRPFSRQ